MLLSLGACGSVAGGSGGVDAAIDGSSTDATVDARPTDAPAGRCDVTKPFGTPSPIAVINGTTREIQAVQVFPLTMFFATDRGGTLDIYQATRASETSNYGTPTPVAGFASAALETSPVLTADGLAMIYSYAGAGLVDGDILLASRTNIGAAFGLGTAITAINSAADDGDIAITGDGGVLLFASNRAGGPGNYDLYQSIRTGSAYGAPTLVTQLNTTAYDAHPRLTPDGLRLYYSSMRTDGGALAGADIWTASRAAITDPFGAPTRVAELNTASNESPTWISADGCQIYFQSNRAGGSGDQDIWQALKPL